MSVAIEPLELSHAGRKLYRNERFVCFQNGFHDTIFHQLAISNRRIESSFSFTLFVNEFDDRAMMCVRASDKRLLDSSFGFDSLADALKGRFRWWPPQIKTHDGKFALSNLNNDCCGFEWIKSPSAELCMPLAIAPHGHRFLRSDVPFGCPSLKDLFIRSALNR
jgi:hypothetical protein